MCRPCAHLLQVEGEPSVGMAPAGTYLSAMRFLAAVEPAPTQHGADSARSRNKRAACGVRSKACEGLQHSLAAVPAARCGSIMVSTQ